MLTLQGISYLHSNGDRLFDDINLAINKYEKLALIGNNGAGKTTLLRIMAGEIMPSAGIVNFSSQPYYLPQLTGQFTHQTVAQALRVDVTLQALTEIFAGNASDSNLRQVGDNWMIEDRCREALQYWNLADISLHQRMNTLSGGQKTKVLLAGTMVHDPEIILLDEPSNHLDAASRDLLYQYVNSSRKTIIVVSHDRALLDLVNITFELTSKGICRYGGNYNFYQGQKKIEANALDEQISNKEKMMRKAKVQERETLERKQKLDARGKGKKQKAGIPTIMMNTLRNNAEKSSARLKEQHSEKIESISRELQSLREKVVDTEMMKLDLDESNLHKGKVLVTAKEINFSFGGKNLWSDNLSLEIRSGERIALAGINGSGKTTLIKLLLGELLPMYGNVQIAKFKSVYIDQDYSLLSSQVSVYELAQRSNVDHLPEHEIKTRLNRFQFSKEDWDKRANALSGGEKMRLLLCTFSITATAPDLIILDEPTNNLDLASLKILVNALRDYKGTLLIVSHDKKFLDEVGIERWVKV